MNISNLDSHFKLNKVEEYSPASKGEKLIKYFFTNTDFFCFLDFDSIPFQATELRVYIDNFPSQKLMYSSNFPIRNIEDLEHELKRIGVSLEKAA